MLRDDRCCLRHFFPPALHVDERLRQHEKRVAADSGKAWIVGSTSAYGGIEIPVDLILADIATSRGWKLEGIHLLRNMRAAGQHWAFLEPGSSHPLRESLIVLEK